MSADTVNAEMFIRRPPGEVFAAFANPQTIRKFWLRDTSGPLAPGARVLWHFMVPGATAQVIVTGFESPRRIGFDWPGGLHVELLFVPFGDDGTHLTAEISGLYGKVSQATDVVEGFSIVFCDLKILLETGSSALSRTRLAELIEKARAGG